MPGPCQRCKFLDCSHLSHSGRWTVRISTAAVCLKCGATRLETNLGFKHPLNSKYGKLTFVSGRKDRKKIEFWQPPFIRQCQLCKLFDHGRIDHGRKVNQCVMFRTFMPPFFLARSSHLKVKSTSMQNNFFYEFGLHATK